jgi:phosphoglycolate phosphatase
MSIKLIIFDLDGTLVDTSRDITNALNHALTSHGLNSLTVKETKRLVGEGITRLVEKIIGENKAEEREEIIKKFLAYYEEHLVDFSYSYPDVKETLKTLKGYKKAVISNKRESLSKRVLENLDLLRYFDMVVGSDTTPERKPSPVPILYVLEHFHFQPDEAVIVGDSNFDIEAGKNAGVKTVAVTYGFREKEYLINADYLIDNIKAFRAILDINSPKLI